MGFVTQGKVHPDGSLVVGRLRSVARSARRRDPKLCAFRAPNYQRQCGGVGMKWRPVNLNLNPIPANNYTSGFVRNFPKIQSVHRLARVSARILGTPLQPSVVYATSDVETLHPSMKARAQG